MTTNQALREAARLAIEDCTDAGERIAGEIGKLRRRLPPARDLRRIEPDPELVNVPACPDCRGELFSLDEGAPRTYCDHCDREAAEPFMRDDRPRAIGCAISALKSARDLLRAAGCPASLDIVNRAIKSAEGAKNHAIGRAIREGRL